jgi:hypothetical protein
MKLRNYLLLSISTILLASCSSEAITNDTPAEERIPLRLQATLSANRPVTRAVGAAFAADDEIISYIQHVVTENETINSVTAKIIKFTTQTATAAYWDDFSESSAASTDLRTANHGLRSYYGYCYNGGTPSTALTENTGVLGWTIEANQATTGIKKYDLLWSKTTEKVSYDHAKNNHGILSVPFTHAMSKFTIVVVAGDGFDDADLTTATVKLLGMNSTGTFTAPTATVVPAESTTVDIDMYGNTASTTDHSRAFEAIAVPQSNLSNDKHLATITMAGNTYKVIITSDMLTSWNDGITDSKSKSNYNYKLTVKLNKQAVDVKATLDDWSDVSATGNGEIQFDADVPAVESSSYTDLTNGDSFSLWRTTDLATMGDATTFTYDGSKFVGATAIYWANGSTSLYFRALAKTTTEHVLTAESSTSVTQGTDLLWGTSGAAAIKPRTGTVPLTFSHAMSKVIVKLATTEDTDASSVDLIGASIKIDKLKNAGTIAIASGQISATGEPSEVSFGKVDANKTCNLIMIPQTISNDAIVTITLKDGSTMYKIQLNTCTAGTAPITAWERGKSYTYTITVKKEAVQFRVLVQDWTPTTGSGNATLDWD